MRRPLTIAAWSGVALVIGSFIVSILSAALTNAHLANTIVSLIWGLVGGAASIVFINGFLFLGKKYKNNLLVFVSWIGIIAALAFMFFGLVGNIVALASGNYESVQQIWAFDEDNPEELFGLLFVFFGVWVAISLVLGAYFILWGIGLMRLEKNKIKYAKTTGILNIVSGATLIIFVGYIVAVVALVFELVLMFKAARKLER